MKTYLFCMGTRPEIIKMAILHRELKAQGACVRVLHTGQHEAMAHTLYRLFDMGPDLQIELKRRSPRLGDLTSELIEGVDRVVDEIKPDVVVVQGDTTSALAGALAGYYHNKPVAHVEAGLRTGVREPFPEEKNRELISRLACWHFAPTDQARTNLLNEGIAAERIFVVGNPAIDAALWAKRKIINGDYDPRYTLPPELNHFLADHIKDRLVLVTAHRRESWGQPIRNIAEAIGQLLEVHSDLVVVWPVHPNPTVRADVESVFNQLNPTLRARICLTEPLDYLTLMGVLANCYFTLTDSGGIQEEASAMSRPVLIARDCTERQELVHVGGAILVGTSMQRIFKIACLLLTNTLTYRAMQLKKSPFGDGTTAHRIAQVLSRSQPSLEA